MIKGFLVRGASLLVLAACAVPAQAQTTAQAVAQTAAPARNAAPARSAAIAVPPIAFTHRTLANGLRVYAIRDTRTANVNVQMWYDVGSKDDPAGRSGFAHLFEHILSRVTRNIPPGGLSGSSRRKRAAIATPRPAPTPPIITRPCRPTRSRRCSGPMPSEWAARSSTSRSSMPSATS